MSRLTVDVVVATRNRARFLDACLASIRAQTLQPARVVVVDDGSTDNTDAVLDRWSADWPMLTVITVPQSGVSAARNAGIANSTADLVAFNDDDDLWHPNFLERQVSLFEDRQGIGFAYCGFQELDADGNAFPGGRSIRPNLQGDIFRDILERFHGIAMPTIVARRSLLIEVGGFDPNLSQGEDRDLCLALAQRSEAGCNADMLVGVRKHPQGAYSGAMRSKPEFVLNQRLTVWNKWRDVFVDRDAVLTRFRDEAMSVAIAQLTRLPPDLGLFRRLRTSGIALARELFPSRQEYAAALLSALGFRRRPASSGPSLVERLKWAVARAFILSNPTLLRLARRLGKFKDTDGNAP